MKSRWRAAAFAVVVVVSSVAAFVWHDEADRSVAIGPDQKPALQLGIYEIDAAEPLALHLDVVRVGAQWRVKVVLTFAPVHPASVNLIVTASLPALQGSEADTAGFRLSAANGGGSTGPYLFPVFDGYLPDNRAFVNYPLATFALPADAVSVGRDVIRVQLPSLAADEDNTHIQPMFGAVGDQKDNTEPEPDDLYGRSQMELDSPSSGIESDANWMRKGGRPFAVRYWQPQHLTTSETLVGVSDRLSDSDIRVDIPSNGLIDSAGFEWQGSYGLTPRLLAVSRASENDRDQDEFLSGIAFATAAAALVALIQEGGDTWTWRPWQRRRRPTPTPRRTR